MPRQPQWSPPPGPFGLADVRPLGVTPAMLRWALAQGRITTLTHGVYVNTTELPEDPGQRHLLLARAIQRRNPAAIASHATAALAWQLDLHDRDAPLQVPQFTMPKRTGARSRPRSDRHIHCRDLPAHHRLLMPGGLRVTTTARTAVDVAATLALPEALITLDAYARGFLLDAVGQQGRRAAYLDDRSVESTRVPLYEAARWAATQDTRAWLREVLPWADPRRESALESFSFGQFVVAGLPLPDLQSRIQTSAGVAFADFLWPQHRVIGEADGALKYTRPEDLVREKRRQEALEEMGFLVVRWLGAEMFTRPGTVVARIRNALNRRS